MNQLVQRLLDLDTVRFGEDGVSLAFERPMALWVWALIGATVLVVAVWSYSRMQGPRPVRMGLGVVRALVVLLLAVLVSGPKLVKRTESVEKDWVVVLADRSASMSIADAPAAGAGSRRTREAQLRSAVDTSAAAWAELAAERTVVWLGFDGGAFDLAAAPAGEAGAPIELGESVGTATRLGSALDQALARAAARPLSAVVVMSDGRSLDEVSRAAMRRLQGEGVKVIAVPLGSTDAVGDVAVRFAEAPRSAFVNDVTPVRVEIERTGRRDTDSPVGATVRLIDAATGEVLDEKRTDEPGLQTSRDEDSSRVTVQLLAQPETVGARTWRIEVESDGDDLVAGNNAAELAIEMVDRPLRVLYIDGYPRWEQRYVKVLLMREPSIVSSGLILAPDRRFTQEGDVELDELPDSIEQWGEFDAVVLGDVQPDVFTEEQLEALKQHVSLRGGGLLFIAGPGAMPSRWWESALADLLPFTSAATDGAALGIPALMRPTPRAEQLGVMRLTGDPANPWPEALTNPDLGWSRLQWVQQIDTAGLKPTAEVLAEAAPIDGSQVMPAVISMRYGAGRVVYVATDETWRWRYARGEELPERFWVQMVRLLSRQMLSRSGKPAVIEVSPRRSVVGQPVRVAVQLLEQALVDSQIPTVAVRLERTPEPGEDEAARAQHTVELTLRPEGSDRRGYSAAWLPSESGEWTAEVVESSLASLGLTETATVGLEDDELRRPETDHEALAALADETDGLVLAPDQLAELPKHIPNRQVRLLNEVSESIWDTPLALVALVLLVTVEWVVRRFIRLI